MKATILSIAALFIASVAGAQTTAQTAAQLSRKIKVGPGEMPEMMSVIMHLAGNREYNQRVIWPAYRQLVDSLFAPHKEHPAVQLVQELERTGQYGFAYDLPMILITTGKWSGGKFDSPYEFENFLVPDYGYGKEAHTKLLAAITQFYYDTDFHTVYTEKLAPLYAPMQEPLEQLYNSVINISWPEQFTGERHPLRYFVTLSYLNSGNNYGTEPPVLGLYSTDGSTVRVSSNITKEDCSFPMVLMHEYLHVYTNPVVAKHLNELLPHGEILFPPIKERMAKNNYSEWSTVMLEAVVRAAVVTYMRQHEVLRQYASRYVIEEQTIGFWWVGALADFLEKNYVNHREKYPTLDSFMPEIVRFYDNLAAEYKRKEVPAVKN